MEDNMDMGYMGQDKSILDYKGEEENYNMDSYKD
jgi:hypothetical protein